MEELKEQLDELNNLASQIYDYFEQSGLMLTRRRLLVVQSLSFVDTNTNAVFRQLVDTPRYLDGAEMIMRSMYDLNINVDWVLKSRDNKRLWRWLRDDRKTLHRNLDNLVNIKTQNPKLNDRHYPLRIWQDALKKTDLELGFSSRKAGVEPNARELSLFSKVASFGLKAQSLYHTMFWLFSTKTHASATGLHELISLDPLHVKRRNDPLSVSEEEHASMLLRTALLWYASNIYRTARYIDAPHMMAARHLYESHIKR